MTEQTSLYRFYSADNVLLYVGVAGNPFARQGQHALGKPMHEVVHIELEWFGSREEAEAAERLAIRRERPLWNKNPAPRPRKLTRSPQIAITRAQTRPQPAPRTRSVITVSPPGSRPSWSDTLSHFMPLSLPSLVRIMGGDDLLWIDPAVEIPEDIATACRERRINIQHDGLRPAAGSRT